MRFWNDKLDTLIINISEIIKKTTIDQIKRKEYPAKIADYTGDILLVGINYDKEAKKHTCKIERIRDSL